MEVNLQRIERLAEYVEKLASEPGNLSNYQMVEQDILSVTPVEVFHLFYARLTKGEKPKDVLTYLDKCIHVFYQSLKKFEKPMPEDSFLAHLQLENQAFSQHLESIKPELAKKELNRSKLIESFNRCNLFEDHYVKKENILFPYLEKKQAQYDGLSIMWSLHDVTRNYLKDIMLTLKADTFDRNKFNILVGKYFFAAYGLIQKEESILFPVALHLLSSKELEEMRAQSFEYMFAFIEEPKRKDVTTDTFKEKSENWVFQSETGELTYNQLLMFLNALPVDCTVIDEHNKVRYFTRPKDRIFPRSPAIIGRDVRNCHPSDSVHMVDAIIEAFRNNEREVATFWIQMRGKKLLIQYFALRDEFGQYKGTVEVSQDITTIQSLEGERRLLEWE